jgi:transposase
MEVGDADEDDWGEVGSCGGHLPPGPLQARAKGRDDRLFLKAMHDFVVHNITWRALPAAFGHWNAAWKRFSRLSEAGPFEALFQALAACSETAGLIQMFDSATARAHASAAGAKGGSTIRRLGTRAVALAARSTSSATSTDDRPAST